MTGSAVAALGPRTDPGTVPGEFTIPAADAPCPEKALQLKDILTGGAIYTNNGMMESEEKEEGNDTEKPLFWIASSKDDLRAFPEAVKDVMGFALYQAQKSGKHVAAKPLKGFGGAAVLEIVADDRGSTFRAVYTVKFTGVVYVLDAFQKKSKKGAKTPKQIIDRIKKRLKMAEEHYEIWCSSQQEQEEME